MELNDNKRNDVILRFVPLSGASDLRCESCLFEYACPEVGYPLFPCESPDGYWVDVKPEASNDDSEEHY